ncbi:MAG TPA: ATP-dependent helicase HrpB [Longimicrobiaceae bacterium]|nr:ATP-dependent helicase HrpB [Longimicrobiaceae bacterium]
MTGLTIESVLPALRHALRRGAAVLQAPPGAGKTTRVPLALLEAPWLSGGRIVMLEPRRLAARAAARRMAALLGEAVGETVGYRMRLDSRVGPRTRVEVVTEGVLTRMLQDDPALEGVGLVVFDEFHERSLHADLGLALCLQARSLLRPELRVLVMSATLDGAPVAEVLGGAPVVTSEGRSFPVATRYLARPLEGRLEPAVAAAARRALEAEPEGDVLVFLPGAGEIRRVEALLEEAGLPRRVRVRPLHGSLPQEMQDRAIEPAPPGERKVVLATSIAETSLTIEGVRTVVDCGRMRVPRFSPRTGMTRLETLTVSRAAADQRRGRAGRLGPGTCYRLWTEAEQHALVPHSLPEILAADLAPLALDLAAWGVSDPGELQWLDPPPAAALAQARELLTELGALDEVRITPHGRHMAALGLHPRLAHMLLRGEELGLAGLACELAALLSERDIFRAPADSPNADIRLRVEALRSGRAAGLVVDRGALDRVRREAGRLRRRLRARDTVDVEQAGLLLALAYPDRIAQRRGGDAGRFLLRNGRGAVLEVSRPLAREPYLAAAELDGQGRESRIFLAAPLSLDEIERHFGGQFRTETLVAWDETTGSVRARRSECLGALVLRESHVAEPDPADVAAALLRSIAAEGLDSLPWTAPARQLQQRVLFLRSLEPEHWPDLSDRALAAALAEWLEPHLRGVRRREDLRRIDLTAILSGLVPPRQRPSLDELAPSHLVVPSGSRLPIDYSDPDAPALAVRIQELFGLAETPRIGRGRVPLTLHLLSPAHRPVQVTRDLASFWAATYFDVRKDLRGRYPKHPWPDDPLRAEPTRRAKRPRG